MTRGWFLATDGIFALCGHDTGHTVPADTPLYRISSRMFRCAEHSSVPVDQEAIDALLSQRYDLERRASEHRAHTPLLRGFSNFTDTAPGGVKPFLRETGGIRWMRPSKPKPFSEVAGDPAVRRAQEAK